MSGPHCTQPVNIQPRSSSHLLRILLLLVFVILVLIIILVVLALGRFGIVLGLLGSLLNLRELLPRLRKRVRFSDVVSEDNVVEYGSTLDLPQVETEESKV